MKSIPSRGRLRLPLAALVALSAWVASGCDRKDTSTTQTTGGAVPPYANTANSPNSPNAPNDPTGAQGAPNAGSYGRMRSGNSGLGPFGDRLNDTQGMPTERDLDRNGAPPQQTATPGNGGEQKNDALDLGITKDLRATLMNDSTLSILAKNVTITSANGVVTLKGTVKTDEEKATIENKARKLHDVSNVVDLVEVDRNARFTPSTMMKP